MLRFLLMILLQTCLCAQVQTLKTVKQPGSIREGIWILRDGLASRIPKVGAINVPGQLEELVPGQSFAIAVVAEGEGRNDLLEGRALDVRLNAGDNGTERKGLLPSCIRQIKATGLDQAVRLLGVGGISQTDRAKVLNQGSMVTIAIFEPGLEVPAAFKEDKVVITAQLHGGSEPVPALKACSIPVRPWDTPQVSREADEKTMEAIMKQFHEVPRLAEVLPLLKAASRNKGFEQASVHGFFVAAFQRYPLLKVQALKALPSLSHQEQWALLLVLRMGGEDIRQHGAGLPADVLASLQEVAPLPDPRGFQPFQDPLDLQVVGGFGVPMDLCWASWCATGDPSYLRAVVGLLAGAPHFLAYQDWLKAKGGAAGLNAKVAEGLRYQVAGWSLSAFQLADPQVTDWLLSFEQDPSLPEGVRKELGHLAGNPAFARPK